MLLILAELLFVRNWYLSHEHLSSSFLTECFASRTLGGLTLSDGILVTFVCTFHSLCSAKPLRPNYHAFHSSISSKRIIGHHGRRRTFTTFFPTSLNAQLRGTTTSK